jgi:hypothetical protein
MTTTFEKARAFIYRNARPLDFMRFQYHFEQRENLPSGASRGAVLNALAAYQNADGGFGHALEADLWNPNSSPIQTWTATEMLLEIGCTEAEHPIIQGILRHLASGVNFDGHYWFQGVPSNNDYPHAPWWGCPDPYTPSPNDYAPTAGLAGFILRFAERGSELYTIAERIAKEAFDSYMTQGLIDNGMILGCYIRLFDYLTEANLTDIIDLAALQAKLQEQVKQSIEADTSKWNGYVPTPSAFIHSCDSIFYTDNKEIADYECEFIIKTQLDDGSWAIPWGWNAYPEEWAVAKNWWKAHNTVLNLLYLKGMGK